MFAGRTCVGLMDDRDVGCARGLAMARHCYEVSNEVPAYRGGAWDDVLILPTAGTPSVLSGYQGGAGISGAGRTGTMSKSGDVSAGGAAACPICAGHRLHPVFRKDAWTVFECAACTNGFLSHPSPVVAPAETADWFRRVPEARGIFRRYWRAIGKAWKALVYRGEFEALKLRRVLRWREGGRLLDIGCARGEFLSVAERRFEVQGVEVSPTALERARATLGDRVFAVDVLEARLPRETFDVITLFSTVEHLHDPVTVLQECRQLLREGGVLVIKTPNFSSLNRWILRSEWSGYKLPEHRFFFSPHGIRQLFAQAGLEPLPSPWFDRFPLSDNMYAYARKGQRQ